MLLTGVLGKNITVGPMLAHTIVQNHILLSVGERSTSTSVTE